MGLFDKITDPLGLKKKTRKELKRAADKSGLSDIVKFDLNNLKKAVRMFSEDPERLLLGAADPLSSKLWGEALGKDYDPIVNQYGGPSSAMYEDAMRRGIDTGPGQVAHGIAQSIASWYGGGALGDLAGAGAAGVMGKPVSKAGQSALTSAARVGANTGAAALEEPIAAPAYDPGPGYQLTPPGYARSGYNFDLDDPYGYGFGSENIFIDPAQIEFLRSGAFDDDGGPGRTEGDVGYARGGEVGDVISEISNVSSMPGGMEMLATAAAEELGVDAKKLRLFSMGGPVGHAEGGLAQAAELTRSGGRGGDEVLLHVSPEEYEALVSMWGDPDINPRTGLPEYGFLSDAWKGIKKGVKKIVKSPIFGMLAPTLLNVFAPGLGSAIGGALGATGKTASLIGNTITRAGIGAMGDGSDGAIRGALSGLTSGGAGDSLGRTLGLSGDAARIGGDAILGGAAAELQGGEFGQGALQQATSSVMDPAFDKMLEGGVRNLMGASKPAAASPSLSGDAPLFETPTLEEVPLGDIPGVLGVEVGAPPPEGTSVFGTPLPEERGFGERAIDWIKENPWKSVAGATALAGIVGSGRGDEPSQPSLPDSFNSPLPNLSYDRSAIPVADYYTYGQGSGEQAFFDRNAIPQGQGTGNSALDRGAGSVPGGIDTSLEPMSVPGGGMSGLASRAYYQSQGWTYDPETQMLYPPGYFGPGGFGPSGGGGAPAPSPGGGGGGRMRGRRRSMGGPIGYAGGGQVHGPGSGRSDDIPAMLSNSEYVIDAESVALLGDGSVEEGSRKLDEMRKKLRQHKGEALSKGKFTPAAKEPEQYMAEGGKAGKKKGKKPALGDLKALAEKLERAVTSGNGKRVREIAAQLNSLSGGSGSKMVAELSRGGNVARVVKKIVDAEDLRTGPKERRAKDRHGGEGRRVSDRLSDKELAEIAEELGGFKKGSKFIKRFQRQLAKDRKKETAEAGGK